MPSLLNSNISPTELQPKSSQHFQVPSDNIEEKRNEKNLPISMTRNKPSLKLGLTHMNIHMVRIRFRVLNRLSYGILVWTWDVADQFLAVELRLGGLPRVEGEPLSPQVFLDRVFLSS